MALKTATPKQLKTEAQEQARKKKNEEIAQKYEQKRAETSKNSAPVATQNTTISSSKESSDTSKIPTVSAVKKASSPVVATANKLVTSVASKAASTDVTPLVRSKTETKKSEKTNNTLSKVVNAAEKASKYVKDNALSLPELTGAVNPNKNNNYLDVVRSAFDKENIDKRNATILELKDNNALIEYYENLPKANLFERLTSFEKNNAYNQRQALSNQYQQAKDASIASLLKDNNIQLNDLNKLAGVSNLGETLSMLGVSGGSAFNNATTMGMKKYLMENGLNELDAEYAANYLKRNSSNETNKELADIAGENTATKALGTLYSFPARAVGSAGDVIDKLADYLTGEVMSQDGTQASRIKNLSQDFRDVASEDLGNVGKFAYGVGTSIGDMATALGLAALTGGGSTMSAGLMGLEKASDVMNEGVERNLTPDQILAEGVASGVTTALTEKIPMGKWDDIAEAGLSAVNAKEIGRVLVASAIPEAGQEAAEDIADAIADALITGDKSQINDSIRFYEQSGLSHEDATVQAWIDFAKQVGTDALAGAISGGVMGGGKTAISSLRNNVDITNPISYDESKGELSNGNTAERQLGYDRTGSEGILRDVRQQGGMGKTGLADGVSGGIYLPANRVSVTDSVTKGEKVFDNTDRNYFAQNNVDYNEFYNTTDSDTFVRALETAKVNNPDGAAVDSHSVENINEILANGGKVFLSPDGTSGGAVENGNLTAVFKDSLNNKTPRMGGVIGLAGVKNGAYKGDCYGIFLVNSYSRSGFEPVARMKYTEGYNPEMDAQVKEQIASGKIKSAPDVYVLKLRDGHNYETCLNNYNTAKRYTQEELDTLPLFDDYDKMMEYRDSLINNPSVDANVNNADLVPTVQESTNANLVNQAVPEVRENNNISYGPDTEVGPSRLLPTFNQNNEFNRGGKASKFALNTLKESDTFKMREESGKWLDEQTKSGLFNYNPIVNKDTVETACNNLSKDFEGEVDRLQRAKEGLSATDVAESMVVLDLLTEKAEKTGDYTEVRKWAKDMQEKVTGIAQGLQMLSHFTRTASSTIMKVEKMADIKAKNLSGKEQKIAKQYSKVLDNVLKKIGYDGSMDVDNNVEKTFQQIRQEVYNSLSQESSSIFNDFTDADIDYLARLIQGNASEKMLFDALSRKFATGHFEISDADIQAVIDLFNQRDKVGKNSQRANDLENQAYEIMSKYLGDATFQEKWNAYRYLAMLGNPRTHLRNVFGNLLFNVTTNVKDNLAGVLEEINRNKFTNENRTRTFISWANPKDAALMRATQQDFYDNAYIPATDNSNKYNMDTDIKRHQKIFKDKGAGKLANYLIDKNGQFLDNEDTWAIKNKYRRALAGYLKANGKTAEILTSKNRADVEFMEKARKFAVEQAKIATFHEDSAFADLLNATSRMARESGSVGGKALNMAIESVFPFKKTPINIFKQGVINYNPVQLVNALKKTVDYNSKNPKSKQVSLSDVIDTYAKGLTGTGIAALGAYLFSKGILRGAGKDEEDYAQKEQEYSINIGNHSFTIDWMAPTALPLFVGAEAYKWWQDNVATPTSEEEAKKFDINKGLGGLADALLSIGNPVMDLSMMQGIANAFNSAASATSDESGGKLASFGAGLATGYAGQAVPTLAGQVARTIDPTRRSTYTGQPYGSVTDTVEKQALKQWNKLPVLSMFNEPYINTFGEEEKNEDLGLGIGGRALQNMVLPGYYSHTHQNEIANELSELTEIATESVDGFKQSQIFPKGPDKKYNGEQLSRTDYAKAQRIKGKTTANNLEELFDSELYQNATPAEQVTLIHDLNNFSNQLYEHKMFGKEIDSSTYKGKYEAYSLNGMQGYLDYIQGKAEEKQEKEEIKEKNNALNNAGISTNSTLGKELKDSSDINAAIEKATGVTEKERQATLEKLDNSDIDKSKITTSAKGGGTRVDWTKAVPYLTELGYSPEERGEILYNTGKISQNEMNVMHDLGYSGVAQYYDNAYYGDTKYGDKDGNREKKEVISYLESLGSSPDDINMWLSYYGWKADYKGQ